MSQLTSTSTPRGLSDPGFPKSQEAVAEKPKVEDSSASLASGVMPPRPLHHKDQKLVNATEPSLT